jgi:hypothetical protein
MKKNIIMTTFIFGMLFISCNDAEYSIRDNSVYLAQAASGSKTAIVTMESSGADINITIRLAKRTNCDVEVLVTLDREALDKYNKAGSSSYELIPTDRFEWKDASLTIPAGEINTTLKVHIDNFNMQGKRYALPVVIDGVVKGGVVKSTSQSNFIYLISKPLVTSVPVMKAVDNIGVRANPTTPWGVKTAQWSLETWVRMSAYSKNNQCIFDNRGENEIYIRFGDANAPYNYLQIKFNGDGGKQTAKDLVPGVWYHWAFVYDGNTLVVYRNGEEDFRYTYAPVAGGEVHFDEVWWISSSPAYFPDQCAMSQMRLWKTAISQTQIKNNMYYEIDPTNPNLIAYWPMNEGNGDIFHDITGNGHDASASVTAAGQHTILRWEHDIRFDK